MRQRSRSHSNVVFIVLAWIIAFGSAAAHPPYRIAVGADGRVYFLDWPTRRVLAMGEGGNVAVVADFTAIGVESHPHALAFDGEGRLVVAESYGRRIWVVGDDGAMALHPFALREDDGCGAVQDLCFDGEGRLLLMRRREPSRFTLQRWEADGSVTTLLATDDPAAALYTACFVAAPDGTIWVTGKNLRRVTEGRLETVAEQRGWGIVTGDDGSLLIADLDGGRLVQRSRDGAIQVVAGSGRRGGLDGEAAVAEFDEIYQVARGRQGRIYVAEALRRHHRLRVVENGRVRTLGMVPVGDPKTARTLTEFRAWSRQRLSEAGWLAATRLDPVRDWPVRHWIETEFAEKGGEATFLHLGGVTALSVAEARLLSRLGWVRIFLPDLARLDAPTAAALAEGGADLHLDGITTLDVETAKALARTGGSLRLGLPEIPIDLASALATWSGTGEMHLLSLPRVTSLAPEVAARMATTRGWGLALDGLTEISAPTMQSLGALEAPYLSLDGLVEMDNATAAAISGWRRKFLTLNGLRALTADHRELIERGTEAISTRSIRD